MVRLDNITKKQKTGFILDHISFQVDRGLCLCLTGPSGCGKTTILRLIAGLEIPDSGRIWINGTVASMPGKILPPYKRQLNMVFQDLALWPHMTVLKHLKFASGPGKHNAIIERIIDLTRLSGHAQKFPHQLSGGEKQRLALARALVTKPEILLLDEPLSSLDEALKKDLIPEIRDIIQKTGITTLYVTHDLCEARYFSDRIVVMENGRIKTTSETDTKVWAKTVKHPDNSGHVTHLKTSEING